MATITPKPRWVDTAAAGFCAEEGRFSPDQQATLAEILGYPVAAVVSPLNKATASIRLFAYTEDAAKPAEQRAALAECAIAAEVLRAKVRSLDDRSRLRLVLEYGDIGHRNADLRALDRLWQNLEVARQRIEVPRHAPEKVFARVAAENLITACECITGCPFSNSQAKGKTAQRLFVINAMRMLGIEQRSAAGAVSAALKAAVLSK
jgi:hypothetical protein